jgi:glycosyltransferase involved in cell wall biosynthesis
VQALITRLDITARVTITGLLPQPDVANALAGAHILVLPNTPTAISDRYTSPLKLFEYLALGRAIVASDLPSLREVLSHNETAVLVQAGDAAALADGLRGLTIDADRRRRLAAAARALAPQYSWAARAARLEAVCEAALAA